MNKVLRTGIGLSAGLCLMGSALAQGANMADGALADWRMGVVRARGLAASAKAPDARRLLQLRRMAMIRAQRDLLEYLKGIHIDSNTSFKEMLDHEEYGEAVTAKVEGTLKGARMVREGQVPGSPQVYEVVMEVPLNGLRESSVVPSDPDKPEGAGNPLVLPSVNYADLYDDAPGPRTGGAPAAGGTGSGVGGKVSGGTGDGRGQVPSAGGTGDGWVPAGGQGGTGDGRGGGAAVGSGTGVGGESGGDGMDSAMGVSPTDRRVASMVADDKLAAALYGDAPTEPVRETSLPEVTAGSATGVIVDATGLGADRALWPRLLGEDGKVLYGNFDLSDDFLYDEGAVQYAASVEEARTLGRAGDRPLVVKARRTDGAYKADLVLAAGEAAKLAGASEALAKLRVILVL